MMMVMVMVMVMMVVVMMMVMMVMMAHHERRLMTRLPDDSPVSVRSSQLLQNHIIIIIKINHFSNSVK